MSTQSAQRWAVRLWPAATFQFCFVAGISMLKPGANALTISRFQTEALPWLYVGAATLTGGLALWSALRSRRMGPSRIVLLGAAITGLLTVGVWLQVPAMPLAAYLFAEAFATQVSLSFWGAVAEAFDAREARRAFTWINGIGMTGAIAGGFGAQLLSRTVGALALLGVAALLFGAAGLAFRRHASVLELAPTKKAAGSDWRDIVRPRYAQLMGALVLCFSLISVLTDFAFRARAMALPESEMADFFGSNQLWTGVFCVVFQLVVAEQLLRRLGILRYLGVIPAALSVMALASVIWPGEWAAWGLKLMESAASWSLLPVAYQLLYAPLPDDTRDRTRRFIDGFWRKGGLGVAGIFLVAAARPLGSTGVLVAVIALCGVVGVLLVQIRARYVEAVHRRVAGVEPTALDDDEERLLHEALLSPSLERVTRAVDLLEHAALLNADHVRLLLTHSHERVQERGVHAAQAMNLSGLSKVLEDLIARGARRPRDAAVGALAVLNPSRARVVLPPLLASPDIGLACAATGGLLQLEGPAEPRALALLEQLKARRDRAPTIERREVARLLGLVRSAANVRALEASLDDADPTVRRLAIASVGQGGYVDLAPKLLRFVSWREERAAARSALAKLGDAVVPLLAATLDDRSRGLSVRLQVPRVLRQVATQSAFDALLFSNARDEPALHYRVGVALAQVHEAHPTLGVDAARLRAALERRQAVRVVLAPVTRDVRAALGSGSLLVRALADRHRQALELSFWLLGLGHDARALRRCFSHLSGGDLRRRAWALELIDNILPRAERELVSDALVAHDEPGDADALEGHLKALVLDGDSVLRTCARATARRLGHYDKPFKEDDMAQATVRRLFALEGVEVFAESDVDDLAAIAAVAKEQTFRVGERVYSEGDPGDALYVIVKGAVEARRDGEVLLRMKEKESFGETSLFDGAPRVNDVVAVALTTALVIDRRDFLDLLADRPELLAGMFRVVSRQLKSMVVEVSQAKRVSTSELKAVQLPFETED